MTLTVSEINRWMDRQISLQTKDVDTGTTVSGSLLFVNDVVFDDVEDADHL